MNKKAVILTGGKQYLVSEKEVLVVDFLDAKEKESYKFTQVLLVDDGKDLLIGTPYVEKAYVEAEIVKQDQSKKIRVAKFKAKSKYRKTTSHRTKLTQVRILKIH